MSFMKASELVQKLLRIPTVRINNVESTTAKVSKILQDGPSNLHFICDFDMTMSRYWMRDKVTDALVRNVSCHGTPGLYSKIDPQFKAVTDELVQTYYPIEIDNTMTKEQKTPFMIEWWERSHKALVQQNLTRADITAMANEAHIKLRPGIEAVLEQCRTAAIPFLVFSAGIGNIIEEILKSKNLLYSNMHIVSNMMLFNDKNVCVGFDEPLIHVFNKSEFQLEKTTYYKSIEGRPNVVLIGDSLGDLQMSQGVKHELSLNIGFCNHDFNSLEPIYKEAFDIVIMRDANFDPVIDLLEAIAK